MSIQRFGTTARYSDVVVHQGVAYLAEVPPNPEAPVAEQAAALLDRIDLLLQQAGSTREALLMVNIYLADMADYDAFNRCWDAWVPAGHAPARACIEARLANPAYRVEIVATAAVLS